MGLKGVLYWLLLSSQFAILSSASTDVSQGICVEQKIEHRKHCSGYTVYFLQEQNYSFICGMFWKECTKTIYRPVPRSQQVSNKVATVSYKEVCCNGFSGVPPNCTAICEPECKNGSRCTSPGMCSGAKNQSGNNSLCTVPCENGGQCTSPDVCACLPTWTGSQCQTVMVPAVLRSERISATALKVELGPVSANQTIGLVTAYKVVVKEQHAGQCSSVNVTVLDDIVTLEVIVDELDPQKMYCVFIAAKIVAKVSEFTEPIFVPLYSNTPLEITLQVNKRINIHSYYVRQVLTQRIKNEITNAVNKVGEFQLTSDSFRPEYITNIKWNCSVSTAANTPVRVSFRFTLISTSINSTELVLMLKYWASQHPVIIAGAYSITVESAQCIDDHNIGANTIICTNTPYGNPPPKSNHKIIIAFIFVAVIVLLLFALCYQEKMKT